MLRRSLLLTTLLVFQVIGCTSTQTAEKAPATVSNELQGLEKVKNLGTFTALNSKANAKINKRGIASVSSGVEARTDWPEGFQPKLITNEKHLSQLRMRSRIKEMRSKLMPVVQTGNPNEKTKMDFSNNELSRKPRPAASASSAKLKAHEDSAFAASAGNSYQASNKHPESAPKEVFQPSNVVFTSSDYANNMNQLYTTLYADAETNHIRVQFDYIDLEPGYDTVKLYDAYGLCAEYTGQINDFSSDNCQGNFVDVYVNTDSTNNGASYDGFQISGMHTAASYDEDDEYYNEWPVAYGYANTYSPLTHETVTFDGSYSYDYDGYISSYRWDFGDGDIEYGRRVKKHYRKPGTYTVTLTVYDNDGDWSRDRFYMVVTQAPPSAKFTLKADPVAVSTPVVIYPVTSIAKSISVDWGDNSTTTLSPYSVKTNTTGISHQYTAPGQYLIVLRATNAGGTSSTYQTVTVQGEEILPTLSLQNIDVLAKRQGKYYNNIPTVYVSDDGTIGTLSIDWGGGSALVDNIETFSPLEKIPGIKGKQGKYTFSRNHFYYLLNNKKKRYISGVFNTTVSATDNANNTENMTYTFISKNVAPTISNKMKRVCTSLSCQFTMTPIDKILADADGTIASYQWDFFMKDKRTPVAGCATTFNTESAHCVFPESGTYFVRFRATDNLGLYKDLFVSAPIKNAAPVVSPKIVQSCQSLSCHFGYDTAKTPMTELIKDKDGTIAQYGWVIYMKDKVTQVPGCSPTANTSNISCVFPAAGTYFLRVYATDNYNLTTNVYRTLTIKNAAPTIKGTIAHNCVGRNCSFSIGAGKPMSSVVSDADGTIASYKWSFLDKVGTAVCPEALNSQTSSCNFSAAGSYTVRFSAKDNYGLEKIVTKKITVK